MSAHRKPAPLGSSEGQIRYALEVRRSRIDGRGLFAARPLPARRKLGEIGGSHVRLPGAWKEAERSGRIYLIEIDPRTALDCSAGNSFRFLNHSCSANCYMRIAHRRVEVYTRRAIRAGDELTVDYGITPHRGGMHCACGMPGCQGRL
ncbi:MAG TPA: SET domain-containing protein-lysine N-methyltransferase [Nevskia sp.]|nr:SET domain-containing protein-lysine N-methyltransferase [Nevskia sp.]